VFYGFPSVDGRTIKIAEHSAGKPIDDPDRIDRSLQTDDAAPVEAFIGRHLPHVARPAERHAVCMYTMTPDQHFIVDRHPRHQNVVIGAGFSGHGFKFTPAIGEALADLALDGRTDLPINFLDQPPGNPRRPIAD
jgi:sarcosine oxidase